VKIGIYQNLAGHLTFHPFVFRTFHFSPIPFSLQITRRISTIAPMADELSSLHIDTDWKKQAQEEKRKLAEAQEKQRAEQAKAPPASGGSRGAGGRRGAREVPQATFASLVNSILTQAMLYLGEIAPQGSEPMLNLDMAKYQVDVLGLLEEKTRNNLTPEEQHLLDTALYDLRTRYINVASQYI